MLVIEYVTEEALREKTLLVTSIENLVEQHQVQTETLRAEYERALNEQSDKLSHQATIEFERCKSSLLL